MNERATYSDAEAISHHLALSELYRSWDRFSFIGETIDLLPPSWLRILNLARNLLEGQPIPGVDIPQALRALTETDVKIRREKRLVSKVGTQEVIIPSEEKEVRPMRALSDLTRIVPADLLFSEADPSLFDLKALSHELRVLQDQKSRVTFAEKPSETEELVEVREKGSAPRQRVYALLDVSGSMEFNHKLIFAKAVMLAYLAKAQEEGAQLYFRAFFWRVFERRDAVSLEEFTALAMEEILPLTALGGTDIGHALAVAADDIQHMEKSESRRRAKTEILLISDCGSLRQIPILPPNVILHTLYLKGGEEDQGVVDYRQRLREIESQSANFIQIDTAELYLPDTLKERWLLMEEIEALEKELEERGQIQARNDESFRKRVKAVRKMTTAYQKMHRVDYYYFPYIKDMEKRAKKLEFKISLKGIKEKLKAAWGFRQSVLKRLRNLKLKPARLSGTLFEFRLGQIDSRKGKSGQ